MNRQNRQTSEVILGLDQESFEISFDNLSVDDQLTIITEVSELLEILQFLKWRAGVWSIAMTLSCIGYIYLTITKDAPVVFIIIPLGLMIYFLLWLIKLLRKHMALEEKKRYIDLSIV
jgi:hypothetical protein